MKIVLKKAGVMLLAMGLLTACSSGNDNEKVAEEPSQEQPEQTDPNNQEENSETQEPEEANLDEIIVDMLPQTRAIELTEEQREFAKKNNDFTFNLYRAIHAAQEEVKSNITSPLSVTYMMGMLNDGADGKTAEEITKVLGFGDGDKTALNAYCQALIQQAPLADPSVTLQIANVVAAHKDVVLDNQYTKDIQYYYKAEVASLDFDSPASLDYLNGWCNERTLGMIPKILEKLSSENIFVLMDAIFFKATWTEKFDENDTKDETFTKIDGSSVKLPMMYRKADIMYNSNDIFSSVCLPFGSGDKYMMYVLLPSEGKTINDIINSLNNKYWEHERVGLPTIVELKLPRFKTATDIVLNDLISNMGAPSIFDPWYADFSGISKNYKNLYVAQMKQKAAIEVSEEGTKASAVTVAEMEGSALAPNAVTACFHANRPFVYLIQEWDTRVIFFIGTFLGD